MGHTTVKAIYYATLFFFKKMGDKIVNVQIHDLRRVHVCLVSDVFKKTFHGFVLEKSLK